MRKVWQHWCAVLCMACGIDDGDDYETAGG